MSTSVQGGGSSGGVGASRVPSVNLWALSLETIAVNNRLIEGQQIHIFSFLFFWLFFYSLVHIKEETSHTVLVWMAIPHYFFFHAASCLQMTAKCRVACENVPAPGLSLCWPSETTTVIRCKLLCKRLNLKETPLMHEWSLKLFRMIFVVVVVVVFLLIMEKKHFISVYFQLVFLFVWFVISTTFCTVWLRLLFKSVYASACVCACCVRV